MSIRTPNLSIYPAPAIFANILIYVGHKVSSSIRAFFINVSRDQKVYKQNWENISDMSDFRRWIKELCNDHKSHFSNTYIIATWCRWPLIFQTMSYVWVQPKVYTIRLRKKWDLKNGFCNLCTFYSSLATNFCYKYLIFVKYI